jgi:hypothetical protein
VIFALIMKFHYLQLKDTAKNRILINYQMRQFKALRLFIFLKKCDFHRVVSLFSMTEKQTLSSMNKLFIIIFFSLSNSSQFVCYCYCYCYLLLWLLLFSRFRTAVDLLQSFLSCSYSAQYFAQFENEKAVDFIR